MILSVQHVSKSFGADPVLKDVSFQIEKNEKFAIVGNNGTGKSTLLRLIVGEEAPDEGQVVFGNDVSFGYLSQYQDTEETGSILALLLHAREDLLSLEKELAEMEAKMSQRKGASLEALLERYHRAQEVFSQTGGRTFRSEAVGILKGLGFSEEELQKDMTQLSGGQKTRASLGRLLMKKPALLLLDEPINHLDLHAIEWLEGYLSKYEGALLLVAHDRYFLDRTINNVVDLSDHRGRHYRGNYTAYVRQKEEWEKAYAKEYEKQQQEIRHQEEVITKLRQFNREKSIRRAESREKMLSRVERLEKLPAESDGMHLSLDVGIRSGNDVLKVEGLKKYYGEKRLFSDVSFEIFRGERIALIGDNGTGKTTMLKILNGLLPADAGVMTFGTNVTVGYYDQEQQALSEEKTLFDELRDAYPTLDDTAVRNTLAAFLFTKEDVFKKIGMLSGGERGRVSLAKLMLSQANFLMLDEPTNHLDMESKEILEKALLSYPGTLFFVSHDRYFINKLATRIFELTAADEALNEYQGNYDDYLARREYLSKKAAAESNPKDTNAAMEKTEVTTASKTDWQAQKKAAAEKRKRESEEHRLEALIEELEEKIKGIDASFSDPAVAVNSAKLNALTEERNSLSAQLEEAMTLWEALLAEA